MTEQVLKEKPPVPLNIRFSKMAVIISGGELMVVRSKTCHSEQVFSIPKFSCIVSRNVDAGISLQRKAHWLTGLTKTTTLLN
jgi:hypothetical protein